MGQMATSMRSEASIFRLRMNSDEREWHRATSHGLNPGSTLGSCSHVAQSSAPHQRKYGRATRSMTRLFGIGRFSAEELAHYKWKS